MSSAVELAGKYFTAWRARDEDALTQILAGEYEVIPCFDLHTNGAASTPTANWGHVQDEGITSIRLAFDPRPILGGGS